ncbi:MAG TPA: hypothetical protein VI111_07975, partial [Thermoleophilaceae bacterium]
NLRAVAEDEHEPREDHLWERTPVSQDTELLLRSARRPPTDEQARLQLADRMERQTGWHRAYAQVWDLKAQLGRNQKTKAKASAIDIDSIVKDAKPIAVRTPAEQDLLDLELEEIYAALVAVNAATVHDPLQLQRADASQLRGQMDVLEGVGMATLATASGLELTRVLSEAGSESVSGPDVPQPAPSKSPGLSIGRAASALSPTQLRRRLQLVDSALSLVILLLTSLVYALTVYDDTWGSADDLATAFIAGFAGQVTVKWALLPIYRSVRLRAAGSPPVPEAPQATGQPAAAGAAS